MNWFLLAMALGTIAAGLYLLAWPGRMKAAFIQRPDGIITNRLAYDRWMGQSLLMLGLFILVMDQVVPLFVSRKGVNGVILMGVVLIGGVLIIRRMISNPHVQYRWGK